MAEDRNQRNRMQRNQEPQTIDTTTTGTHPAGNLLTPAAGVDETAPRTDGSGLIWIEREDQAKQGMARKGDMRSALAAPDRPHIGHVRGSGEAQ